jgi:DNA-binding transcriptional ArsR family regulator
VVVRYVPRFAPQGLRASVRARVVLRARVGGVSRGGSARGSRPVPPVYDGDVTTPVRTSRALTAAGDLLRALAAPVRIAIVLQLRTAPRCVHDLVDALDLPQPLISQHLRVLKDAGVVRGERHGREVVYSLVDDHLAHIVLAAVAHAEEGP